MSSRRDPHCQLSHRPVDPCYRLTSGKIVAAVQERGQMQVSLSLSPF